MNRRTVLALVGGIGIGGYVFGTNDPVKKAQSTLSSVVSAQNVGGPPPTENKIKTATPPSDYPDHATHIKIVELYESGAAKITLAEDHSCYERIGVTHEALEIHKQDTSEALRIWDAPQFSGPLVVNMKSAIQSESGYPSRRFRLRLLGPADQYCFGIGLSTLEFTVPSSYL